MPRRSIHAEGAPPALGPYVHAVAANGWIFASGQIGLDPATNELAGPDTASEARQVLDNLAAVLAAAGAGLQHVVKVTVYLADLDDFPAVNRVYATYFDHDPPARACVAVRSLPKGARVEMDAIAVLP